MDAGNARRLTTRSRVSSTRARDWPDKAEVEPRLPPSSRAPAPTPRISRETTSYRSLGRPDDLTVRMTRSCHEENAQPPTQCIRHVRRRRRPESPTAPLEAPDDLFRFFCFDGTAACPRAILWRSGCARKRPMRRDELRESRAIHKLHRNFCASHPTKCKPSVLTAFPRT